MALAPSDYLDDDGKPFKTWEDYACCMQVRLINEKKNWFKAENLAMAKNDECKRLQERIDILTKYGLQESIWKIFVRKSSLAKIESNVSGFKPLNGLCNFFHKNFTFKLCHFLKFWSRK